MATAAHLHEPTPPHLRPSRFSRLILQTPEFESMTAWYRTVLSTSPMFENDVVCLLSYGEEHHRIRIGHNPEVTPREPEAAGVVHFAYTVETLEELVNTYLRLESSGIGPHHCIEHAFTTSLYYHDPDGNEVELAVDSYRTREAMDAGFATGAFDRDFVGVPFDPARTVRPYREGVVESEILQKELYR